MVTKPAGDVRVMLDTSVLLSGVIWPRWPYEVLQHAIRGDYRLVMAPLLLAEARRKYQERFPAHAADFEAFLASVPYDLAANPTAEDVRDNQSLMRDSNDVPIALAAIQADVDYFVSEDRDFTDRNETTALLHSRLTVLLSGTFLRVVMGWSSEELERVGGRSWPDLAGSDFG